MPSVVPQLKDKPVIQLCCGGSSTLALLESGSIVQVCDFSPLMVPVGRESDEGNFS